MAAHAAVGVAEHPPARLSCAGLPEAPFSGSLERGEAVLRFPYDERLRRILRAIPGRRWDPVERAWRVPLEPEAAEALSRLFAGMRDAPSLSRALERKLAHSRSRRRRGVCVIELVRPDEHHWLSFATDAAPRAVSVLLSHPRARTVPAIGRALLPIDELSLALIARLRAQECAGARAVALQLSTRALRALASGGGAGARAAARAAAEQRAAPKEPAAPARWRGTVDVERHAGEGAFVLLGDPRGLPRAVRERARAFPGGCCLPLTRESWRLMKRELDGWPTPAARRCAAALEAGRPAPGAVLELSRLHDPPAFVLVPGHQPGLVRRFSALEGALPPASPARGAPEHARLAALRADPFCVPQLDALLEQGDVWVAEQALELLCEIREQHARAAGVVALSAAHDAALSVRGLCGELKPFQRAGVRYALSQRRTFLADEQGLGKTVQALAAMEADGAYPALVVCPASLKLLWLRELGRWLPHRAGHVLRGNGPDAVAADADVVIANYDILHARLAQLQALAPRALVIDESHHCKNPAAKRTQAVQRLAAEVPRDGLVLALSGTPVVNRASELTSQLRILGRLQEFGSGARLAERFQGADAHARLHWHLRARCFARRLKADVLPQLPAKTRAVVPVEIDNEAQYRLAERDLIAWLREQPLDLRELDARVAAALRAERLVRLNALKLLAARGKLGAALRWIHDFHVTGERLVVFAHHREILRAVLERFPAALHVLGEDSADARERAVQAFQLPDSASNRLIVCSIEVAGQGITLTRASSVVFLELGWTPARHEQAEDRCHRIGQRDAVNATYLLAAGTVDEAIAELLERKRGVIGAVTDGRVRDEEAVLDALVRELRGAPYRNLRAVA
jgi:SWI/SNF-related matrix-associated actin-dependent regulator of chromatin subfamily A-like protein 1